MSYPRSARVLFIGALFIGAILLFYEPLKRSALTVVRFPFTLVKTGVSVLLTLPRLPKLSSENAALRSAIIQHGREVAELREALRHAKQAQALVEASSASQGGILARVIGRSLLPTQQTLLLDKGQRQGLALESVALDAHGIVGRVVELNPTTCLVMLLTDPESRVAALVERSRETGLLVGLGEGSTELVDLDVHADVETGDRIVSAGLGGLFPKGLLLGTVMRISRDEESGSAAALVEPAAQLGRLEEVLCVLSHETP